MTYFLEGVRLIPGVKPGEDVLLEIDQVRQASGGAKLEEAHGMTVRHEKAAGDVLAAFLFAMESRTY